MALALVAVVAVVGLVGAAPLSIPTNFYVSSTRGSDTNAGTTPDAPLQSLTALSSRGPFGVGTIRLERGSVWVDQTLNVTGLAGGAVTDYGDASHPRPAIWHSRSAALDPNAVAAARSVCLRVISPTDSTISNIHIAGCFVGISLEFPPGAADTPSNVTVTGCSFADIRTPYGAVQPSFGTWATAVRVTLGPADTGATASAPWRGRGRDVLGTTPAAVSQLTISHNIGIRLDTFFQTRGTSVAGLVLSSNTVARCGGNCVAMEASDMHLLSSVFLRDTPENLFLYGTTDVIIGTVSGNNSIEDNDFNSRGEYEAGPDGCAVDFETSASGFLVRGNTFYRSWGAGIMVFGHSTTSHGLTFSNNAFVFAGCTQPRGDRAGIALMCPNGNKPSGTVADNQFLTCPSSPAILPNPSVPGCGNNVTLSNNQIDTPGLQVVDEPQLSFNPPSPDSTDPTPTVPVIVFCTTPNATIRYTIDGSRPDVTSPVFPTAGLKLVWPGPNVPVNVRAFKAGYIPSVTNGVIVERRRYLPRVGIPGIRGSFDSLAVGPAPAHSVVARGWVVDPALRGGGMPPVTVAVSAGGTLLASVLANTSRPDLVKAKVAPNANHGFEATLDPVALSRLQGQHVVELAVIDTHNAAPGAPVNFGPEPLCLCGPTPCKCG